MSDVFISYANEDRPMAERLAASLARAGLSVWWDRKIPPGQTWDSVIGRALDEAKCVIVLWSRTSVASRWVREEAEVAAERGILVPAAIEDVILPIGFRRIEGARLIAWDGDENDEEFQQLLQSVKTLAAPASSEVLPPQPARADRLTHRHFAVLNRAVLRSMGWAAVGVVGLGLLFSARHYIPGLKTGGSRVEETLRVWKVGSPHEGDTPDTTLPFTLNEETKKLGVSLNIEGFPAQGFATRFFEALRQNAPPDVLVIDNYGIIEGITTKQGNFAGIGRDAAARRSLVEVKVSFDEFLGGRGGWTFLITSSKNHAIARKLALRPPECQESAPDMERELREIVPVIASAYLEGAWSVLDRYADPAQLRVREAVAEQVQVGAVRHCGAWANDVLAFVPVTGWFEAPRHIGYEPTLLVFRKHAPGWQLLTAARDPVSTGEFTRAISSFVDRLDKSGGHTPVAPPRLLSPPAGQPPAVSGGERFGNFVWRPSQSAGVIGEVIEFAYRNDARLFLKSRPAPGLESDQISSGSLWTTRSTWLWRVWSISHRGDISFSEARSFPN